MEEVQTLLDAAHAKGLPYSLLDEILRRHGADGLREAINLAAEKKTAVEIAVTLGIAKEGE